MATVNHQLNFTTKAFRDKGGEGREIFTLKRTQTEIRLKSGQKFIHQKHSKKLPLKMVQSSPHLFVLPTSSIPSSSFHKPLPLHLYLFMSVFPVTLIDCCKEFGAALIL